MGASLKERILLSLFSSLSLIVMAFTIFFGHHGWCPIAIILVFGIFDKTDHSLAICLALISIPILLFSVLLRGKLYFSFIIMGLACCALSFVLISMQNESAIAIVVASCIFFGWEGLVVLIMIYGRVLFGAPHK